MDLIVISDVSGNSFRFNDLEKFRVFCISERDWWERQCNTILKNKRVTHEYVNSYQIFNSIIAKIHELNKIIRNIKGYEQEQNVIQRFVGCFKTVIEEGWLWSGYNCSKVFCTLCEKYGQKKADIFISIAVNGGDNLGDRDFEIYGLLFSSELKHATPGDIVQEKIDFEDLKGNFSNLQRTQLAFEDDASQILNNMNTLLETEKSRFGSFLEQSKESMEKAERTYHDTLRFTGPARYWRQSARRYYKQGSIWASILIFIAIFGMVFFYEVYQEFVLSSESTSTIISVKQVAMLVILVTIYAFIIRSVSRLTFSSFHLMRDSEERRQLTHLYLSLSNKNKIDDSSRDLVLQALFSRTETGLLSGDSSPSMPGINELISTAMKVK
ncbi:DUF6161 domain-containing protein [Photobacterium sp. J15]|uniref:DUF6161 domain-containing protein n=1 Tax=Photobacterium sp. J15 TaxID=265901 RepID=UPI0007E460FE|nr:DUF6161 domain-containing protein [Photobacterium sp. J15]